MASCNIFSSAPSVSMEFRPYVPPTPKSNPRRKARAKAKAKTNTADCNHSDVNSSKDSGQCFHIDDLSIQDSNASRSLNPEVPALFGPAGASGLPAHDVVSGLGATFGPEKLERCQINEESLDEEGTDRATSVAMINSAPNGLFGRSSLESPSILDSDGTEERYSTTRIEPIIGASIFQENRYHAATSTERHYGQHGDFDAANITGPSEENMKCIFYEQRAAEDEPYFDIDATSRSPLTGKRTRSSSGGKTISLAEVPDITSELELEDTRLVKRQRLSERQTESLVLDNVATFEPMSLPTPSGLDSRFGASIEPSTGPFDNGNQGGGGGETSPPFSSHTYGDNSDSGAHTQGIIEELPYSPRQSYSSLEGVEGEAGESREDELSQVGEVFSRPSVTTTQRSKRSIHPVQRGRGPSRTTSRRQGRSTMPTRTSRNVTSYQPRQLPMPRTENATQSCFPQTSSLETGAGDGINNNHGFSANPTYQITDLTRFYVPKGTSIVTAIVRCNEPSLSPNPTGLEYELLRGEGKVIRMMQLSPDSWMLLGYRYNGGVSSACNCEDPMLLNADRMSSPLSDTTSDDNNHPDDGEKEDEEGSGEYRPHSAGNGQRLRKDNMRSRKRTRIKWSELDELRLLAYRKEMNLEWKNIFERFSDRTPGAVRTRWYMLQGK